MIIIKAELKPSDVDAILVTGKSHSVTLDGGVTGSCCDYNKNGEWFLVKIADDLDAASQDIESMLDNDYKVIIRRV